MPGPNVDVDVNKTIDQVMAAIREIAPAGAALHEAVIGNATGGMVTFNTYNYVDNVYWVDAAHPKCAPGHAVRVAASGQFFKIHPNGNKDEEYLVAPGKRYVYEGPGKMKEYDIK